MMMYLIKSPSPGGIKGVFLALFLFLTAAFCSGKDRWAIQPGGSIRWTIDSEQVPHYDHLEMSGEYLSAVLRYGVNKDGSFRLERSVIWPMLRTLPNNTHASLTKRIAVDFPSLLLVEGEALKSEQVRSLTFDGCLTVVSDYYPGIRLRRELFPSVDKPVWCERYYLENSTDRPLEVTIPDMRSVWHTDSLKGVNGSYTIVSALQKTGIFMILPGEEIGFEAFIQAYSSGKQEKELTPDIASEQRARKDFVREMWSHLVLETPDEVIDRAFAFAKIRASESIYRTAGGLMHGPGGEAYYAAIWANDESEYVAPFFPLLGYRTGNEATLNAYRLYMGYMNDAYKPVPSSIIAEGLDTWQNAGDCGDAAMLAYGGLRYALARGDRKEAEYLWPLMEWCLEYCNRKLNAEGVVRSDHDELEGRFPSGEANLLVSSLYYDALISAVYMGKELNLPSGQVSTYKKQAVALRQAIEDYFGSNVEGFETYGYYKGNTLLRSWICAPLFTGIDTRAKATMDALYTCLWTKDGLLSQTGIESFWDRSTLSALRAGYTVGDTDRTTKHLSEFSRRRLLGDHVPYPVESWPEGNQRHLSGESALYCRVITEGMFGIRPCGLNSFTLTPRLPESWDKMSLRNIRGFGSDFDIFVSREGGKVRVIVKTSSKVIRNIKINEGKSLHITLN